MHKVNNALHGFSNILAIVEKRLSVWRGKYLEFSEREKDWIKWTEPNMDITHNQMPYIRNFYHRRQGKR
jgi:hypothetical protein